jgi:NADPH:quinone reductase-like Zn-dependent oxidoreductase
MPSRRIRIAAAPEKGELTASVLWAKRSGRPGRAGEPRVKAIVIPGAGGPDVLREEDRPDPTPEPGGVVVDVEAAGVNFADLMGRAGLYPDAPEIPFVPGYEVCGRIAALGDGVDDLAAGDRVVGFTRFGGYAERARLRREALVPVPDGLVPAVAAAVPVNFVTAWMAVERLGALREGETALVLGGAGGVGTAAIQLVRARGGRVIAAAGGEKAKALPGLGAAHAIDHRTEDPHDRARELTGGRGVDLVLDPISGASVRRSLEVLAPLGRVVCIGVSSLLPRSRRSLWRALLAKLRTPRLDPWDLMNRNVGVLGVNLARLWDEVAALAPAFSDLVDRVAAGELRPVLAAELPLSAEGAREAHRMLHERRNVGKVVLVRHS